MLKTNIKKQVLSVFTGFRLQTRPVACSVPCAGMFQRWEEIFGIFLSIIFFAALRAVSAVFIASSLQG